MKTRAQIVASLGPPSRAVSYGSTATETAESQCSSKKNALCPTDATNRTVSPLPGNPAGLQLKVPASDEDETVDLWHKDMHSNIIDHEWEDVVLMSHGSDDDYRFCHDEDDQIIGIESISEPKLMFDNSIIFSTDDSGEADPSIDEFLVAEEDLHLELHSLGHACDEEKPFTSTVDTCKIKSPGTYGKSSKQRENSTSDNVNATTKEALLVADALQKARESNNKIKNDTIGKAAGSQFGGSKKRRIQDVDVQSPGAASSKDSPGKEESDKTDKNLDVFSIVNTFPQEYSNQLWKLKESIHRSEKTRESLAFCLQPGCSDGKHISKEQSKDPIGKVQKHCEARRSNLHRILYSIDCSTYQIKSCYLDPHYLFDESPTIQQSPSVASQSRQSR